MKSIKNILINAKSLILVFIVISIISVSSVIIELQQSKKETLSLLEQQGHTLLESLLEASKNTLLSYEKIENELKQRLIDNGKMIRLLYNNGLVTNKLLQKIAADNKIYRINIFNRDGDKIYSSAIENASHKNLAEKINPKEFIQPIFDGEADTLIIGLKPARFLKGDRFAVALSAKNRSAIVLNIDAKSLLEFREQVGFGVLIKNIVNNKLIEYIAVQNEDGIIAGSGKLQEIENFDSSAIVKKTLAKNSYVWHIVESNNHKVFEALHPLTFKKEIVGIFRLGLSLEPLNQINQRTQRRMIFLSIVLLIFGTVTIVLIFVRQNFDSLSKRFSSFSSYTNMIFKNVSDAIIVLNHEDKIKSINRAAENLFSIKTDIIIDKNYSKVFAGFDCKKIFETKNKFSEVECTIGDSKRIFFVSKSEFLDENKNLNRIFILREITEMKNLERQITRNEKLVAMSELASSVAHEIRNPLNSIGTITQQLGKDFVPKENLYEYETLTKLVYKEVRRINEIVENFLKYSRPKPLKPEEFQLDELLNQLHKQYENIFSTKKSKFLIDNKFSGKVYWDKTLITQVFINLIENSLDAIPDNGEIKILVNQINNTLKIYFSDNGKGISNENIDRIFNLYFTTKPNGSGIGLSIVHKIISEHNGSISVKSAYGKETIFTINLPLKIEKV